MTWAALWYVLAFGLGVLVGASLEAGMQRRERRKMEARLRAANRK